MKELINEEEVFNSQEDMPSLLFNMSPRMAFINGFNACKRIANQRHEAAMKERAIEFAKHWESAMINDYVVDAEIERVYNEKYGSDERD